MYEIGQLIPGKVLKQIKGGYLLDIGTTAFLPNSQAGSSVLFQNIINTTILVEIIKIEESTMNIVVSRLKILREEKNENLIRLLSSIKEGQLITGIVKRILDFGVFIDIGGIDGLLHINNIKGLGSKSIYDLFSINQELTVTILQIKENKISLSYNETNF